MHSSHVFKRYLRNLVVFQENARARRQEQEKELRDAEDFLEKIKAKKEKQLVEWKVKHELLRRGTLALDPELRRDSRRDSSQPKLLSEPTIKTEYGARKSLTSTWNIKQSLLDSLTSDR